MPSPWYLSGRSSHIHEITSSKIYYGKAPATMSIPKIELVACLTTYIRTFCHSTDGSLTHLRTVLHDQCENSIVTDVVKFLSNTHLRYGIALGVLSFRDVRLPPSYVPKVSYGARKVVAETTYEEFLRIKKIKLGVDICYTLDVVYDEDVAMRLAEMESEEEEAARRRQVKVAVETRLEEEEWEGNMGGSGGTCTICLEEFGEGVKVLRMPCSHSFHRDCIWRWLVEESNSCPLCRGVVQ